VYVEILVMHYRATSAVDRLYGDECETIDEVLKPCSEGYSTVTQAWISDQILTIKLKTAAIHKVPREARGNIIKD
jgi:hypothetical protein